MQKLIVFWSLLGSFHSISPSLHMDKHIFLENILTKALTLIQKNKWDQQEGETQHNPYHTSVKFFVYHHFSHASSFVLSRIYVRKHKTLGAVSNYWQSTRFYCVEWRSKAMREEVFSLLIRQSTFFLTNHHAWIFPSPSSSINEFQEIVTKIQILLCHRLIWKLFRRLQFQKTHP